MRNRFLIKALFVNSILILSSFSLQAEECKFNVKKKGGGYTLIKECLKVDQPDLASDKPIKVEPYTVLKNFDNLGTEDIEDDGLYSESIFQDKKEPLLESEKKSESLIEEDQKNESAEKVNGEKAPEKENAVVKKLIPDEKLKNKNSNFESLALNPEITKKSRLGQLIDDFNNRFQINKRLELSSGYFKVNAVDSRTNGVLKIGGGSNRLDYVYSMISNKWTTEFSAKLDFIMMSNPANFKTLNNEELLIGGKISTGYSFTEDRVGGSVSRAQIATLGRFGRDPKKDIVLTSIASTGLSLFYTHSFGSLFDCKFETTYLLGGENEHFIMESGQIINLEASRLVYEDLFLKIRAALIFEGSTFKTEGVENKDSRVMAKFSFGW